MSRYANKTSVGAVLAKTRLQAVIAADRESVPCGRWVWRGFKCTDLGTERMKCIHHYRYEVRR